MFGHLLGLSKFDAALWFYDTSAYYNINEVRFSSHLQNESDDASSKPLEL
jgi:hypothetical protein